MDVHVLKSLANIKAPVDDLTGLLGEAETGTAAELRAVLEEHQKSERASMIRDSAFQVAELVKISRKAREMGVTEVRQLRSQISQKISSIENMQMAEEYGLETMNFIPLAVALGRVSVGSFMGSDVSGTPYQIPSEWIDAWKAKRREANIKAAAVKTSRRASKSA